MAQSDKLERLLNLMAALLETHQPLTAEEIRRRVPGYPEAKESFRRAFERDKDDLREMGIPLSYEPVFGADPPREGYRIPKDQYYLRDPGLEPDELAALHLAASAVRLEGIEGLAGLWKLGGAPAGAAQGGAGVDVASLPADDRVVTLFSAVAERRPATFRYRDAERTVDPYRIDFQRGRWYVTGFDHLRGDERNFRVERIEGDVRLGRAGSFARPSTAVPGVRMEGWQLGEGEPIVARVLVDADQAYLALHQLGADAVAEERADGSVVFSMAVTNAAGFRSFVLGFLEHAEVLDPPELRAAVVDWLEDLVAR